jgi:hypothetical protein
MSPSPSVESQLLRRYGDVLAPPAFAPLSHERLMSASRAYLERACRRAADETEIVATRLLENPVAYRSWESEHAGLMRTVAAQRMPAAQREAMLSTSLSLIHRRALFQYLREKRSRGAQRERLIRHFFPQRDFTDAVRFEHMQYVRSSASFLCVEHVGRHLMFDALFADPLDEYEDIYREYFHAHCDRILAPANELSMPAEMLSDLKSWVAEWRKALLALTHSHSGTWRRPKV